MKQLKGKKLKKFIKKYFECYNKDIKKVTYFNYRNITEYLINDHYIFIIKKI